MRQSAAALLAFAVLAAGAEADTLEGPASVLSGDTIEVRGQQIRLLGIDAPEPAQACWDAAGEIWPCGQKATLALTAKLSGASITCNRMRRDREGQLMVVCRGRKSECLARRRGGRSHTVASSWPTRRQKRTRAKRQAECGRGVRAALGMANEAQVTRSPIGWHSEIDGQIRSFPPWASQIASDSRCP